MVLNEPMANAIFEAIHVAWSRQDLDAMLAWFCDDLTYFCNTGAKDLGPIRLHGKAEMRAFLQPIIDVAECVTVPVSFTFQNNIGRAQIEGYLKHRATANLLTAQYRQVVFFDRDKVTALEEFHDAARMRAFWRMVKQDQLPTA